MFYKGARLVSGVPISVRLRYVASPLARDGYCVLSRGSHALVVSPGYCRRVRSCLAARRLIPRCVVLARRRYSRVTTLGSVHGCCDLGMLYDTTYDRKVRDAALGVAHVVRACLCFGDRKRLRISCPPFAYRTTSVVFSGACLTA